jgi:sensor histidine kinase regulating citrate/malate metabolism
VTTKLGHAGVGLALVGDAVAAAGGTIETASGASGTTFTVTIPYGAAPDARRPIGVGRG